MTKKEQRIAIAEARGWRDCKDFSRFGYDGEDALDLGLCGYRHDDPSKSRHRIPDYLNDLNVMAEVVASLDLWQYDQFQGLLVEITGAEQYGHMSPEFDRLVSEATAAQRAEAYLKTIGEWKETQQPTQ